MKDIIFNFGIVICLITYCLLIHNVVKNSRYGIKERKLTDILFTLFLLEMFLVGLSQIILK
jgi:hypothetical protein